MDNRTIDSLFNILSKSIVPFLTFTREKKKQLGKRIKRSIRDGYPDHRFDK
jgi:hypothetical protein